MNSNHFFNHLRTRVLGRPVLRIGTRLQTVVKLLVIVDGQHDVAFLRVISRILRADKPTLPDLGKLLRAKAGARREHVHAGDRVPSTPAATRDPIR